MTKPIEAVGRAGLVIFFCLAIKVVPAECADKKPPAGSISINNAAAYTSSTEVTLNILAKDKGSGMKKGRMCFSNKGYFWSDPERYKASISWSLAAGDGEKMVYARFCDSKGNWTANDYKIYARITLDTSSPSTPAVTDDGSSVSLNSSLHAKWSSSDPTSGISEYQYQICKGSSTGTAVLSWTSAGTSAEITKSGLSLESGQAYYFQVKARNNAGLWSAVGYSDGITVEDDEEDEEDDDDDEEDDDDEDEGDEGPSDATAPNITQVSPQDKSFVYKGDTVTLSISTDDEDSFQNKYQFSIDGSVKQGWSTKSSYSWDTSSSALKKYTLKFEAKDDGGSSSQEINVFLIKEPVSPPEED